MVDRSSSFPVKSRSGIDIFCLPWCTSAPALHWKLACPKTKLRSILKCLFHHNYAFTWRFDSYIQSQIKLWLLFVESFTLRLDSNLGLLQWGHSLCTAKLTGRPWWHLVRFRIWSCFGLKWLVLFPQTRLDMSWRLVKKYPVVAFLCWKPPPANNTKVTLHL